MRLLKGAGIFPWRMSWIQRDKNEMDVRAFQRKETPGLGSILTEDAMPAGERGRRQPGQDSEERY